LNQPGAAGTSRGVAVLLVLVMLTWGLNIPAVKALTGVMDAIWVGAVRLVGATLVLTVCLWLRDRRWPRIGGRQWALLAYTAFLMIYANQVLFVTGVSLSSATNTALLMATIPLLSLIAGAAVFRERLSAQAITGIVLGFGGVLLVVVMAPGAAVSLPGLGEAVILIGLVTFVAGGLLIQRITRELDVLVIGWAIYVMGTAMLAVHVLFAGGWERTALAFDDPWVWWLALYSGIAGTALSNVGWYFAINRVGQSRASPYLYLLPIFGVGFSAALLGEPLGWWHLVGLVLVIAGTRLGSAARVAPAASA